MGVDQLKELKRLHKENERLRRAVSDMTLDKLILKEAARVYWDGSGLVMAYKRLRRKPSGGLRSGGQSGQSYGISSGKRSPAGSWPRGGGSSGVIEASQLSQPFLLLFYMVTYILKSKIRCDSCDSEVKKVHRSLYSCRSSILKSLANASSLTCAGHVQTPAASYAV